MCKNVYATCVHVPTELPFCMPPLAVGYLLLIVTLSLFLPSSGHPPRIDFSGVHPALSTSPSTKKCFFFSTELIKLFLNFWPLNRGVLGQGETKKSKWIVTFYWESSCWVALHTHVSTCTEFSFPPPPSRKKNRVVLCTTMLRR